MGRPPPQMLGGPSPSPLRSQPLPMSSFWALTETHSVLLGFIIIGTRALFLFTSVLYQRTSFFRDQFLLTSDFSVFTCFSLSYLCSVCEFALPAHIEPIVPRGICPEPTWVQCIARRNAGIMDKDDCF